MKTNATKTRLFTRWIAVFGWLMILSAQFASATFVNGSFESGLTGWTANGNVSFGSASPINPVEGARVAVFNGGNSMPNGFLSQHVTVNSGVKNRLEFHVGNLSFNTSHQRIRVRVLSLSGNTFLGSLIDEVITINGQGGGKTNWQASAFEFVPPTSTVRIAFSDASLVTNSLDLVLDRVRLAPAYQVSVTSVVGVNPGAVNITTAPFDAGNAAGGATPFQRTYLEGSGLTLTAPRVVDGYDFEEWRQNGVRVSGTPQISIMIDANTTLEAVYGSFAPVLLPSEPFEVSGAAGTGPFTPSSKVYRLTNATNTGVPWSLQGQTNFDAPTIPDWVTISPMSGFIEAGQELPITVTINSAALNLPPGKHKGVFQLLTPFHVDYFLVINLTANGDNVFANGGFESDFAGWTKTGNVSIQSATPYGPTEGTKLAAFNASNSAPNGILRRTVATVPGSRYLFEFDAGNLSYNSLHQRLQVNADEVVGGTTRSHVNDLINIPGAGGGATAWIDASYDFIAIGNSVTLTFTDVSQATNSLDLVLDNVRLVELPRSPLVNGGFESGLNGWTATGNVTVLSGAPYTTTEGANLAVFNSSNSTPNGSLSQEVQVVAGEEYRLDFDMGNLSYNSLPQGIRVQVQYRMSNTNHSLVDRTFFIVASGTGTTNWFPQVHGFIPPTDSVTITFTDLSSSTNATDLVLDRVRLSK